MLGVRWDGEGQKSAGLGILPLSGHRAPLLSICGRLLKLHLHHPAGHCCFQLPLGVGTVWWETRAIAQGSPRGMFAGLH